MECNKDEAVKAKELAEKKFAEMDIAGAKKLAEKAKDLYAGLDGLPQLLATLDVCISAGKRINGEVDWYGVLGVEPLTDDETIKKRFRNLALILHPDKNKLVGADGAFKILSEAWSVLSDKAKRIAYDQKLGVRGMLGKAPNRKSSSSVPINQNGFQNFSNDNNLNSSDPKSATHSKPVPPPHHPSKRSTFWTLCNCCRMQFEYHRTYLNRNLLCPKCRQPFLAVEMPHSPINGNTSTTPQTSYMQQVNSNQHTMTDNSCASGRKQASATYSYEGQARFSGVDSSKTIFQSGTFPKSGNVGNASAPASSAAQPAAGILPVHELLKRWHEGAQKAAVPLTKTHGFNKTGVGFATGSSNAGSSSVPKGSRPRKGRRVDEDRINNTGREMENQMAAGNGGFGVSGSQKGSFQKGKVNIAGSYGPNSTGELSQTDIRNMLMKKCKIEIRKELNEWSAADASKTSDKESMDRKKGKQMADVVKCREFVDTKTSVQTKKSSPANSEVDPGTKDYEPVSMSVPDPDFHDFDKDRTEKSFGDNQVWAAYDDDDGMPRYYAMIHRVISLKPFKMQISWLNSKSNNELAPLNWIGSGFSKTSGDFRIGKYVINNSLNSFSHKVKWTKGSKGAIQIYPKKGDVWALYRSWSPDWNVLTPNEVIHKYDMVEVLEDYNEERGVTVAPLVKVAGFKAVFRQHLEPSKIKMIPREELFRFSHQVPSYMLTGQEGQNAPRGCRELDPASTPMELLRVLTEVQLEERVETVEMAKEENLLRGVKNSDEELVANVSTTKEKGTVEDAGKKVVAEGMMNKRKATEGEGLVVYKRRR